MSRAGFQARPYWRIIVRLTSLLLIAVAGALGLTACADLRANKPLLPVQEYERLIVGRLDAEYVGTDNCVAKCHRHDDITRDFKRSIHGEQIKPDTRLPLVNCESCHGPGSLAIAALPDTPEENDLKKSKCRTETFLNLQELPPQARSLICLKCHAEASIPILSHWNASPHALHDVSCTDCHKLHQGPGQKVKPEEMAALCYRCHPEAEAQFSLSSHHPVTEKKMACIDCHDVHGSAQDKLLKGTTTLETCTRCHMEKQGPFLYGHGDLTENCLNCHQAHGSVTRPLLTVAMPFLCLQCHQGHAPMVVEGGAKKLFANRCTDCHSQIHGSNIPSAVKHNGIWSPGKLLQ